MPETRYEDALDDEAQEWLRMRIVNEGRVVTSFTAQYETTIDGVRHPVVRFDTAHGYAHRHLLNRKGNSVGRRRLTGSLSFNDALQRAQEDLIANWRHYRRDFLRDEHERARRRYRRP
jgi:hypothetical protein